MRFEVPQFIEIEDKIFGPLTWRQFLYVAGSGGFAVITLLIHPLVLVVVGIPIAILGAALAFYPVNNRPFVDFLRSMTMYYKGTKEYHWKQSGEGVYRDRRPREESEASIPLQKTNTDTHNIASLARRLELEAIQKK